MKTVSLDRIVEYLFELKDELLQYNDWRRSILIDAIRWQLDHLTDEEAVKARKLCADSGEPEFKMYASIT